MKWLWHIVYGVGGGGLREGREKREEEESREEEYWQ